MDASHSFKIVVVLKRDESFVAESGYWPPFRVWRIEANSHSIARRNNGEQMYVAAFGSPGGGGPVRAMIAFASLPATVRAGFRRAVEDLRGDAGTLLLRAMAP